MQVRYFPETFGAYAGVQSYGYFINKKVIKKASKAVGEKLDYFRDGEGSGFRYIQKNHGYKQLIHIDDSKYSLVVNLDRNQKEDTGTYFWKHKETGLERYNGRQSEEILKRDGNDKTKWELLEFVPGKFNEGVLFDSKLFHSPSPGYGLNKEDARLIQIMFLEEYQGKKKKPAKNIWQFARMQRGH